MPGPLNHCKCHHKPRVFKGGCWRCPVKYAAVVARYRKTDKRRACQRRYHDTEKGRITGRRTDQKRSHRRVRVGGRQIRMPTDALTQAARALVARRRQELKEGQCSQEILGKSKN